MWTKIWTWLVGAWKWLETFFQFLDGPADANGVSKFSHKRLIALACVVTSIILAFRGGWISSAIYLLAAIILAIISAITKT